MTGRFHKGRPYVSATVMLTRLNLCGEVEFMLDTGADMTLLSPPDAMRLGCDLNGDVPVVPLNSWGGRMEIGLEQAIMVFDDIAWKLYGINIGIVDLPPDRYRSMPSVIGMDLLSRWRITWEPREDELDIEPKHPDWDEYTTRKALVEAAWITTAMRNGHRRVT
jgi:hypothetical protein